MYYFVVHTIDFISIFGQFDRLVVVKFFIFVVITVVVALYLCLFAVICLSVY